MRDSRGLSRRRVVAAMVAGIFAPVAGCSEPEGDDTGTDDDPNENEPEEQGTDDDSDRESLDPSTARR